MGCRGWGAGKECLLGFVMLQGTTEPWEPEQGMGITGGSGQVIVACPHTTPSVLLLVSVFESLTGLELSSQVQWLQS